MSNNSKAKKATSDLEQETQYLKTEVARLKLALERKSGNNKTCMETCESLNSIHDGLLRFIRQNGKLRCIYGNDTIRIMLGFELPEIIGRSLQWFFSPQPETHQKVDLYYQNSKNTNIKKSITLETYFKSKHGSPIPVLCSIKHNNKPLAQRDYLVIVVDIRVLKSAQEKTKSILHAERISTLGHLAAGIAHEINNPLSFLLMDLERQKSLYEELEKVSDELSSTISFSNPLKIKKYSMKQSQFLNKANQILQELNEISNATDDGLRRISEVVRAVKTYGKTNFENNKRTTSCNIEEIIDVAIRLIHTKIKKSEIELIKNYVETPSFQANPGQIVQVVLNLLLNSIQAITNINGKIEIRTYYLKDKDIVGFDVQDNGLGISSENIKKIFNPYFTTKKDGTGLGLGIISNIIHELGGSITVSSQLREGSTFSVFIPVKKSKKINKKANILDVNLKTNKSLLA